jgi:predicted transcriptional regulator
MVTLADLVDQLELEPRSARKNLGREVTGGYASDLLSDVIANSREGDVWITLQAHQNVVAVAVMKDLAGIILVGGREPEEETVEKAETENIPVLVSRLPTFELAGRLYNLGIRGVRPEEARQPK